jgi:hypothetical protein
MLIHTPTLVFSLAPGFSRVSAREETQKPFQRFFRDDETVKTVSASDTFDHPAEAGC